MATLNIKSTSGETDTIKKLSIYRRNILHFRRIIDPQKYLIANLSNVRRSFLDEENSFNNYSSLSQPTPFI